MVGRKIPEAVRRAVREECGYCCVMCGRLNCDYEHIEPYHVVQSHDVENIALLCIECHGEVTRNRISKSEVDRARRSPFYLHDKGHPSYRMPLTRNADVDIGGNQFTGIDLNSSPVCFYYLPNGSYLFAEWRDGIPLFTGEVHNINGKCVLAIEENTLTLRVGTFWDFRFEGSSFKLWAGTRQVLCELQISASTLGVRRMRALCPYAAVDISESEVRMYAGRTDYVVSGNVFAGFDITPGGVLPLISTSRAMIEAPSFAGTDTKSLWRWMFRKKLPLSDTHAHVHNFYENTTITSGPFALWSQKVIRDIGG